jgi:undecaprenyl-diphosphatase
MQKYRKIDRKGFYLLLLLLLPFLQLCYRTINKNYYQLDIQIVRFIEQQRNILLDFIVTNVYRITGTYFTGSVVLMALLILIRRRYWPEVKALIFATLGILLLVDQILKPLFDRPRPPKPRLVSDLSPDSFPSGHAAGNLVFYFYLSFIISARYPNLAKYVYSLATILVLLIGFSSVYTKAHWATDIIAGYSFGYFWLLISLSLLKYLSRQK